MRSQDPRETDVVVIVTVDATAAIIDEMVGHARVGIERFGDCDGYVSGTLHRSSDGERLVQVVRWRSMDAYEACRDDPRWDALPTTEPFLRHVTDGSARLDVRTYEVISTSSDETAADVDS